MRQLLASDYLNSLDDIDVDSDGYLSPLDVLVIVNDINKQGSRQLPTKRPEADKFLVDVNGDGFLNPLDALVVINRINRDGSGELSRDLRDGQGFSAQREIVFGSGQTSGTRRYYLSIDASFSPRGNLAIGDLFAVYVVDMENSSTTLIDRGISGSPIFTMTQSGSQITPGVSTFDGRILSIDLTSVVKPQAVIKLQLLNHDASTMSRVVVKPVSNQVDPEGVASSRFSLPRSLVNTTSDIVDTSTLGLASTASVEVSEVKSDNSGAYEADISITNTGLPIGRNTVVLLNGLPPGVTVTNATGLTPSGVPYLNLREAIGGGGLGRNQRSSSVRLKISNPGNTQFSIRPTVMTGSANRAPVLAPISDITVKPGEKLVVKLSGQDSDADEIRYNVRSSGVMPTTRLQGNELHFSPKPTEIGNYQFEVVASDGSESVVQTVRLSVVADPVTTTRLSGQVLDVDGTPLSGLRVEVGSIQSTTSSNGRFILDFGNNLPVGDTLRIRADLYTTGNYPFIAEKLPLLLEHDVYRGFNNQVARAVFIPKLNGGIVINPASDQTVTQQLAPNEAAAVKVKAGSLFTQQGSPFNGKLSITEVPVNLTPVSLPVNLIPDVVLTIQPGEMVFATPAPMTFPNRAGRAPGTLMDLWSINPSTGQFEDVGDMRVSADGKAIETISGGIRYSSWHFPAPPDSDTPNRDDDADEDDGCDECKATGKGASEVELHSGAYIEYHSLVPYQSLGQTRGFELRYDSLRADPRPIVFFGYDNVNPNLNRRIIASANVKRGDFSYQVPGYEGTDFGLRGGEHIWSTPSTAGPVRGALQIDLRDAPTGIYKYDLTTGIVDFNGTTFSGRTQTTEKEISLVNSVDSFFGSGWGLSGLVRLYENPDRSLLFVDGDGSELYFGAPTVAGNPFVSPPGDFSSLVKLADGSFRRIMKDKTTDLFASDGRIISSTDRVGNRTQFIYDAAGIIERIIDPVGLTTVFASTAGRITSITDPGNRITNLQYDAFGNLTKVTDPDGSFRTWNYDDNHHIIGEIDKLGRSEATEYNFAGRVTRNVLSDGTEVLFSPVQTQNLKPLTETTNPRDKTPIDRLAPITARYSDSNGNVKELKLDKQGQAVSAGDVQGATGSVRRDNENLVVQAQDGRGNVTGYKYDDRGNMISKGISVSDANSSALFPGEQFPTGSFPRSVVSADVNGDGRLDLVTANSGSNNVSVLIGNGLGGFSAPTNFSTGAGPLSVVVADMNGDDRLDLVTANSGSNNVSVLIENGLGGFSAPTNFSTGSRPLSVVVADVNGDGRLDLVTANSGFNDVSVLLGNGLGGFSAPTNYITGSAPSSVVVADMNGDGRLDLVTANYDSDSVSVLIGNGQGGFSAPTYYSADFGPDSVVVGDMNGDKLLDIVTANSKINSVTVLIGNGRGGFSAPTNYSTGNSPLSVVVADMNGDNRLDIVTANYDYESPVALNNVSVLNGDGLGGFSAPTNYSTGSGPLSVVVADMNGDDRLDIVTANYDGSRFRSSESSYVLVLNGNGLGGFSAPTNYNTDFDPYSVVVADMNGDNRLDLVTANGFSQNVSVFIGNGLGGFSAPTNFNTDSGPYSVVVVDMNGDNRLDLVTANSTNVSVLIGNGLGGFSAPTSYSTGSSPSSVVVADMNGDSRLDIVTANSGSNNISVLIENGLGGFSAPTNYSTGSGPSSVVVADMNGDGRLDIVTANSGGNNASVLIGNGLGVFSAPTNYSTGSGPSSVVVADMNGDGRLDIVTANGGSRNVSILIGNGVGGFSAPTNYSTDFTPESVVVADMNGDGRLDLVTANGGSRNVSILIGNGLGGFSAPTNYSTGYEAFSVVAADLNGDDRPDLALIFGLGIGSLGGVSVLLNSSQEPSRNLSRSFSYDTVFNQPLKTTDELGRQTNYEIDPANGNILSVTQPESQKTFFTYTYNGLIDTVTDALGRVTDFDYDSFGRTTTITYAKGTVDQGVMRYEYDLSGNRTAAIDENSRRSEFSYDAQNRLILVRDALGNETSYKYNKFGKATEIRDSAGHTTTNQFDDRNRLIRTQDSQNNVTEFKYDSNGNVIEVRDPLGNLTKHRYDSRNRRVETIDPDNGVTTFRYDADNNLVSLKDSVGNQTLFFYDARNRLVKETDPLGKSITYKYDGANNLIEKKDRNARVVKYQYDGLNRLTKETWVDGGNVFTYSYDATSNLKSGSDSFSALAFTYDARNRVDTIDNLGSLPNGTPNVPRVFIDYVYDPASNVLSVIDMINGSSVALTNYVYDNLNRLSTLTQSGTGLSNKRVDFSYNPLGQYDHIRRSSDLAGTQTVIDTAYAYDSINRLTSIDHKNGAGTSVSFFNYQYDATSRIKQITSVDGVANYGYDKRDQLTSADYSAASLADENYRYDANGNRIQSHLHGTGYTTEKGNRLKSDGTYNYDYDNEGNIVKRTRLTGTESEGSTIREFTWDFRNRLTTIIDKLPNATKTQEVRFTYDVMDRRISKSIDTTPTDTVDAVFEHYVYDREDVILDFVDGDGSGAQPATLSKRYLHGPDVDQVLAQDNGAGQVQWQLSDHLGTVRDLVNNSGAVVNHIVYDSFGNVVNTTNPTVSSRYSYTGRELDRETGLYYYRARYYESVTGRFTSEDPIRYVSQDANYFRYVNNSPIRFSDPLGLDKSDKILNWFLFKILELSPIGKPIIKYNKGLVDEGKAGADAIGVLKRKAESLQEKVQCEFKDKDEQSRKVDANRALMKFLEELMSKYPDGTMTPEVLEEIDNFVARNPNIAP